jgi:hypothetical protein
MNIGSSIFFTQSLSLTTLGWDLKFWRACAKALLLYLRKQVQTTKSTNLFGLEKEIFKPTHKHIMQNIENNSPFLAFPLVF